MRLVLTAATATLIVLVSSCSAIVDISEDEIRCFGEGASDPCPFGRVCRDGYCQLVMSADSGVPDTGDGGCIPDEGGEICNGEDDDCDGVIDNGHDQDGDNFTWCGGGIANQADCDDSDPNSFPGNALTQPALERCDGADNDCDGMIDEDGDVDNPICPGTDECLNRRCADPDDCTLPSRTCEDDEFCDRMTARCMPGGCATTGCPPEQMCNDESGECITPVGVGGDCFTDMDCVTGAICIDRATIRASGADFCSQTCCTDAQCPSGNICWASGSGARVCVPPAMVGTSSGGSPGGAGCSSGRECASGVCREDNGTCLSGCGSDLDCVDGRYDCVATVLGTPDQVQFTCGEPNGTYYQGEGAYRGSCASGLRLTDVFACTSFVCDTDICVGSCRTTADCPSDFEDLEFYCGTSQIDDFDGVLQRCSRKNHGGNGANGATCTSNAGCRDLACIDGRCADSCCSDADCASGSCRPVSIRGHWETHCIPDT